MHPHRTQHLLLLLIVFYIKTKPVLLGPWMQTASTPNPDATVGAVQLGLVGLGRMGANMRDRLRAAGIEVFGYSRTSPTRDVTSLSELVDRLAAPRTVWIMVPAGDTTRATVTQLAELLAEGDLIVDGGNSRYTDDQVHAQLLDN